MRTLFAVIVIFLTFSKTVAQETPAQRAKKTLTGLSLEKKVAQLVCAAKHFPGRGDMKGGPAYPSCTTLNKSLTELNANEFKAFGYAIEAGVDFMMTGHMLLW